MRLLPKQNNAVYYLKDSVTTEILYGGGAGGGKSALGCLWLIECCQKYPGTRWLMGRKVLKTLKETTLVTFFDVSNKLGIGGQWEYKEQKGVINFSNGSQILLKELELKPSDPEFDSLGSLEITGAFIDECNQIVLKAVQVVKSRCRYKLTEYGLIPKVFMSCNPAKNWVYKLFYRPWRKRELAEYRRFIQALPTDNPHLPKSYLESLDQMNEVSRQRLKLGNWEYDDDKAALISYDAIMDYWNGQHVKPEGDKYLTIDVARKGKDKTVFRVWHGWVCVKRYEMPKCLIPEIVTKAREIQGSNGITNSNTIADEDGVGCLMPCTEVMTTNGWKQAKHITTDDVLISKDENNFRQLVKPYKVIEHENEEFIDVNNKICFTIGHTHFYKTRKRHSIKHNFWEQITNLKRIYNDTVAYNRSKDSDLVFESTKYKMPNGGYKDLGNSLKISKVDMSRFLGWYVSEGDVEGNKIKITQSKKSKHNDCIEKCLNRLDVNWNKKHACQGTAWSYYFHHKAFAKYLKDNCYTGDMYNCYNKRVPKEVKTSSKESVLAFCETFIKGDGFYHKNMMQFCSSSHLLLDDIQEMLFFNGIRTRRYLKHKKGSIAFIHGRKITRTTDSYVLSELTEPVTYKIENTSRFYGPAINIKIPNKTKALLIRQNRDIYWTHNGGVVDYLGCKGFVNNSKPLLGENYDNLKSQCSDKIAKKIEKREVVELCSNQQVIDDTSEEMEQIKIKDIDKDGKVAIEPKNKIKELIGRSPDDWDSIMMRMYFDLVPPVWVN